MGRGAILVAVFGLVAACSTGDGGYGVTTTGPRHGVAAAANGGSIGTAGATSAGTGTGGGTTGAATSSSGTTGASCRAGQASQLNDCLPGMVELVWVAINLCEQSPLSIPASFYNFENANETSTNDACGNFHLCVMPGEPVVIGFEAPNFFPEISQTIVANESAQLDNSMQVYCQAATELLPPPASMQINTTLSQVAVNVDGHRCSPVGWSVWLEDSDGGVVDAGVLYGSGSSLAYGTETQGQAGVLFFNVDPAIGSVTVHGLQVDAGMDAGCEPIGSALPFQFAGPGLLESSSFTYFYFPLP